MLCKAQELRETHGDGKVETLLDGEVDGVIESLTLASSKGHVGDGSLVLGVLALSLERSGLTGRFGSPGDSSDDVGHGSGSSSSQNLDGNDSGLLGDTVLGRGDGTSDVGTVAVQVLVGVLGNRLSPLGAALELGVVDVDTGVDNVGVDALSTGTLVLVAVEGTERERLAVRDPRESLSSRVPGLVHVVNAGGSWPPSDQLQRHKQAPHQHATRSASARRSAEKADLPREHHARRQSRKPRRSSRVRRT